MTQEDFPTISLNEILNAGQLPAMPQTAVAILNISRDPTNGAAEYADAIGSDPGLTLQVLKFVNSSYFGFRNEISNVKQAISLVGTRTIKNFTLYTAVFSMIPNPHCGPFDLKKLWQDSLRRALFARRMGKVLGMKEAEEPFAAALLQDMAVPLLAKEVPDAYVKLFGARANSDAKVRLSRLEEHVFGWTHAEAAGIVARQWNLPEDFATLIEDHLQVERWSLHPDSEPGRLAVSLSALLPTTGDSNWTECQLFDKYYRKVKPSSAPAIEDVLRQTDKEFADFAPIMKMAVPEKTLADRYSVVETTAGA
ncbi:MAG: HDOD domain-containing protein [Planctomycetota bacterium]|nr:HDOD domain-containing protein [Planctomycetota bacterium]